MLFLAAGSLSPSEVTLFLLALGVLLGSAKLLGEIARHFNQPAVLGELLAGVILGPTLLGGLFPGMHEALFPTEGNIYIGLEVFITVSVILLLLVAGLEVDLSSAWRQGRATLLVGALGMVIPAVAGFALAWFLPSLLGLQSTEDKFPFALFVGIALSITALSVIAKILMDLNMGKSDIGTLILSAAMMNDLIGWIAFAMLLSMVGAIQETGVGGPLALLSPTVLQTIVLVFVFLGVLLTAGRFLVHRALPIVQAHTAWPGGVLVFTLVFTFLCAAFTEWIGVHAIFGAFIAGIVVGDSYHLRGRTRDTIHQFVTNIFAPLFFASIGLWVNFVEAFDLVMVLLVLVVACVGKIGGCYLGAKLGGLQQREAWAVGAGMVARGGMEIILAQFAFSLGLIGESFFVTIVIMALATSLIAGPGMRWILQTAQRSSLAQVVSDKTYVARLKASTRQGAILELAHHAASALDLDHKYIFNKVWQRERIMPTGLEHNIAVPHARLDDLPRPLVVVGVSPPGIDFNAPDGGDAHIICLLLTPAHDPTAQLELLNMVARAFADPEARHRAMIALNFTEFRAALSVTASEQESKENESRRPPGPRPDGADARPDNDQNHSSEHTAR